MSQESFAEVSCVENGIYRTAVSAVFAVGLLLLLVMLLLCVMCV